MFLIIVLIVRAGVVWFYISTPHKTSGVHQAKGQGLLKAHRSQQGGGTAQLRLEREIYCL